MQPTEIRKEYNGEGIADPTGMNKRPSKKTQRPQVLCRKLKDLGHKGRFLLFFTRFQEFGNRGSKWKDTEYKCDSFL